LSESEQLGLYQETVSKTLGDLELPIDLTRDQYKALVQAQDLSTEAGRRNFNGLMKLAPAFDKVAKAAEQSAEDLINKAKQIADERQGLVQKLLQLENDVVALRALEIEKLDESNRALQNHIWALEDYNQAVAAATAAAQAVSAAEAAVKSVRDKATDAYVSASQRVADAQKSIADLAIESAKKMREFSNALRDFVRQEIFGQSGDTGARQLFAEGVKSALSGNAESMSQLPQLAQAAIDTARAAATNSAQFNAQRASILADVLNVANVAGLQGGTATATEDPLISANKALEDAIREQTDALLTANRIGASLSRTPQDLVSEYKTANENLAKSIADKLKADEAVSEYNRKVLETLEAVRDGIKFDVVGSLKIIDTNLDDQLTWEEFKRAYAGSATEGTLRSVFNSLDSDNSGVITRLEAIVGNTGAIANNIGKEIAGIISGSTASGGLDLAQFEAALKTEAEKSNAGSLITPGFASGLFTNLDKDKSGRLTSTEASAATITSSVSELIASAPAGTQGSTLNAFDTEYLRAQKGIVASSPSNEAERSVTNLYARYIGRTPDQEGLIYWRDRYEEAKAASGGNSGVADAKIAYSFSQVLAAAGGTIGGILNQYKSIYIGQGGTEFGFEKLKERFFTFNASTVDAYYAREEKYLNAKLQREKNLGNNAYANTAQLRDAMASAGLTPENHYNNFGKNEGLVFAKGGVFSNQVVTRPTSFELGLMGEAGPEAIMPLTRTRNGSLGVVAQSGGDAGFSGELLVQNRALIEEVRALRGEVNLLRYEARATASSTNKTTRILERVTRDGESLLVTDSATL
jgi:hypothetical protein